MNIHVDLTGVAAEKECDYRKALARKMVRIGGNQRPDQYLVAHGPVIDEKVLVLARSPMKRRQAGKAGQPDAFALGVDRKCVVDEISAKDLTQPLQETGRRLGAGRKVEA